MTVETTNSTISYTGNGSVTIFAYDFLTYSEDHLFVYLDDIAQGTGFSVSGVGEDDGGNITFDVAPLSGVDVRIDRTVPVTQEIEYQEYGPFPAKTNERGLDLGVMIDQQNERDAGRNATEKMDKQPTATESNIVIFDSEGNSQDSGFAIDDIDGFTPVEQARQAGDNAQTQFDTPSDVASSPFEFQVRLDGLRMRGQTDYTTGTIGKIDFTIAPSNLAEIDITWFKPLLGTDAVIIQEEVNELLINDLSQAYTFKTAALMQASLITFPVGKKITWQGYYAESDGGSNWGIVKSGVHTDDGGEFFTLADGKYVQANIKGKRINAKKYGANGDGVTPTRAQVQNAIIKMEETGQTIYFPIAKYIIEAPLVGTDNKPMFLEGDDIGAANNGDRPHTELIFTSTTPEDALIKCGAQVHLKIKGLYFTTNDNSIILHGIQVGDRNLLKGVGGDDARLHQNTAAGDFLVEDSSFVDFGGTALILGGETIGVINRNGFNRNSTHIDYDAFGEFDMARNHFSSNIGTQTAPKIVNGGGPYPTPYTYTTDTTRNVGVYIGRTVSKVEKNVWASSFDKPFLRFDSCNVIGLIGNTMERPGNTVMASNMIEFDNDGTFTQFGKSHRIEGNHCLAGQATGTIAGRIIKFSGAQSVARCMSIKDNAFQYGTGVDDFIPIVDCTDNTARPKEILIENNMVEATQTPLLGFADGAIGGSGRVWLGGVKGADVSFHTVKLAAFTVLANQTNEQAGEAGINFIFYYEGVGAMYIPVQIDIDATSVVGAGTETVQFYTSRDLSKADLVDMEGRSHQTTMCAMREEYMHDTRTDQPNNMRLQYDSGSTADTNIKYSVTVTYAVVRAYNRGGAPSGAAVYVGTSAPA